jgi:hypothetical protein
LDERGTGIQDGEPLAIKIGTMTRFANFNQNFIKLKEMNRSIESLRKLIDLLNADFSLQNANAAVLAND